MSLLPGQFVGRRHPGDGHEWLQKDRQTVVDRVRHLYVFITPAAKTQVRFSGSLPQILMKSDSTTDYLTETFSFIPDHFVSKRLTFHSFPGTKSLIPLSRPKGQRSHFNISIIIHHHQGGKTAPLPLTSSGRSPRTWSARCLGVGRPEPSSLHDSPLGCPWWPD